MIPINVTCDCGGKEFEILFHPPMNIIAECTTCGERQPIGDSELPGEE